MVTDFGCLGGALMIAMPFFVLFGLSYILSYEVAASFFLRGQNTVTIPT
jgi:hypothetical protein